MRQESARMLAAFTITAVAIVAGLAAGGVIRLALEVRDLRRDVACLKHPTGAASSITATTRNGITIQTAPQLTVCP